MSKAYRPACVIASNRPWNRGMVVRLQQRTGYRFETITDPGKLTVEHLTPIDPRYLFFPHWSHRIDLPVFTQFECVIFHMTDRPFQRGGSPLQNLTCAWY